MARRINKPLIGGLTVFSSLAAIAAATAMIVRLRPEDPRPFIELAERHAERGDYRRAAGMYGRAALISRDAKNLALAGQMWVLDGNLEMARATWEAGKTLDPTSPAPREASLRFLLDFCDVTRALSGWQAVDREARELLALSPAHASALHASALAARELPTRAGSEEEILDSLRRASELDPTNVRFALDYAGELERRGRGAQAETVLREACARIEAPAFDVVKLWCGLGMLLGRADRLGEAKEAFEYALSHSGAEAKARSWALVHQARYALSAAARARLDEGAESSKVKDAESAALKALEEAARLDPEDYDAFLELGRLYLRLGRFEDALHLAEPRVASGAAPTGLAQYRARARVYESALLAAEACIRGATQPDLSAAVRDGWITRALGFVDRAQVEWEDGPRGHLLEGEIRLLQGRVRDALASLAKADARFAQTGRVDWRVKTLLARLHLEVNEPGTALQVLSAVRDQARKENPSDPVFWTLYAEALVRNERAEEGLEAAEAVLKGSPDHKPAKRVKLAALTMLNRAPEAEPLARELDESGATAVLLRARSLIGEEQYAAAYDALAAYLDGDPGRLAILREAVFLAARAGREDDARRRVASAIAAKPDEAELRRLSIVLDPSLTDAQRSEAMLKLIEEDPDPLSRALRKVNFHATRQNDAQVLASVNEAVEALQARGSELADADRRTILQVLKRREMYAAARLKDWARAEGAVEAAVRDSLDDAGGAIFKGELRILKEDYAGAASVLQEAIVRHPNHAYALTLLGASCFESGRLTEAKAYFQRAAEASPRYAPAQRGLALAADRLDDRGVYEKALDACAQLIPGDPWVAEQLLLRAEVREPQEALERRLKIREAEPGNVRNLLQLARLCQRLQRVSDADRYFGEALGVAPNNQEVVFKAADHHLQTGRADEGERIIRAFVDVQGSAADRANAMLTLSAFYLRSGRLEDVERVMLEASRLAETFEVCLSLGDFYYQQRKSPGNAAEWFEKAQRIAKEGNNARWIEALVRRLTCALDTSVHDLSAAQSLLEEARESYPNLPDWLYWSATIAGLRGRSDEAVSLLNQYLQALPDDAAGLYARAQHQMMQGQWSAAIADLERLKARNPAALDLRPRIQLAFAHESAGRSEAAVRELESLASEFPNSSEAARELMFAYLRADRVADALRIATQQVNRARDARAVPWLRYRAELHRRSRDESAALADDLRVSQLQGHRAEDVSRVLTAYLRMRRATDAVSFFESAASARPMTGPVLALYAQALDAAGRGNDGHRVFIEALTQALDESFASAMRVMRAVAQTYASDDRRGVFSAALAESDASGTVRTLFECALMEGSGNWQGAVARLAELVSTTGDAAQRATLRRILAMTHHAHDDTAGAIPVYETIVAEDPRDVVSLNNLANLLAVDDANLARAEEVARQAVSAASGGEFRADAQDTLGWILSRRGRYPEAIAALNLALRLKPDDATIRYHLGETYRRAGQFELAVAMLDASAKDADRSGDADVAGRARASAARAAERDAAP
ncbi:MAG: tetratricopeptide repeat protein [Phycisphaerae bacterium]|nr:MAG: tetratricopeptide repeat protein [Phycisphaerae bacterium]MBE7458448.1 tetratricopeptide repeat protein [Planctomycetia bacterium]MCK6464921.1 tetratricopeptide repeat protein [Phycisphaerae bacterium]MCL4719190.1 tetratricopeptide repeat protein [Phycisphaerae bacterium]NUQ08915.1 tetratricopeptide repeat protein [Phycisphaerae bacterium]